MRKLKLFFACLLMAVLSIGQVWGAEEKLATLDFTTNTAWQLPVGSGNGLKGPADYSDGTYTINLSATTKYYFNNNGYLMIGKQDSKLTLPAFTWTTTKIVVYGNSAASGDTKQNIYVGSTAVSTETKSSKVTQTYNIDQAYQAAGNVYIFQVTSTHNAQVTKIEIYGEAGGGTDPVAVTGVTLDKSEAEVAVGKTITLVPTVAPSDATNKAVTWESDDEDIATVANGVVTGVAEGTANITVKTVDGNKTATCEVTVTAAPAADSYELVTNVANLAEGDKIIIVNADATKAISTTQNSNNRGAADVTATNDVITPGDDVQVLTLGITNEHWTLYTGTGYLYAASSSSNNMKTQTTNNANGEWTISIASDRTATIVAQGSYTRNNMRYNSGSTIFSCYASTSDMAKVKIYKKVTGTILPPAELSYAAEDQNKLTKLGETFTAPTLVNPHGVAVTYASSAESVAEVAANGAVTIKAIGVATITASFDGNDDYKAGSASYTIGVTTHAGTEADPYDVADVKTVIDAMGTMENAYASGIVSNIYTTTLPAEGYISFYFSADGATTGQQVEAYKCYGLNSDPFEALTDVKIGATVVVTGTLKKYNSTYEFDQNCHLVSYEAPAVPKQSIANTKETAYTVAQALAFAADPITYETSDSVYIKGVVYNFEHYTATSNIYIRDIDKTMDDGKFEFFKCGGLKVGENDPVPFSEDGVHNLDTVIGYGVMTYYSKNDIWEFPEGNYVVEHKPYIEPTYTISFDANTNAAYTGDLPTQATVTKDDVYQIPAACLERTDNYYQAGWNTDKNATDKMTATELSNVQEDVVLYAIWKEITDCQITFYNIDTENAYATKVKTQGVEYTFDDITVPTAPTGYTFAGWSTDQIPTEQENITPLTKVTPSSASMTLYAVYTRSEGETTISYQKVTSAPDDWSGNYLIVNEEAGVAFDGSLETLDATDDVIGVTINAEVIASSDAVDAAIFTVAASGSNYTLRSASGKYIGVSSNSNGLKQSDEADAYINSFGLDADNNAVISAVFDGSTMSLRYNKADNQNRFRYYKNAGQQAIQLYAQVIVLPTTYYTTKPATIYTVSFSLAEDESGNFEPINVVKGENAQLPTATPTKVHNTFNKWSDGENEYAAGAQIENVQGNIVLHATWDPATYATVTFDPNGPEVTILPIENVYEGEEYQLPAAPAYDDAHVFTGWKLGDDVFEADQVITMTSPAVAVEYVAQWADKTVTNVVILASYDDKWFALTNEVSVDKQVDAMQVDYYEGQVLNLSAENQAKITWVRTVIGDQVTFKNGDNYIVGTTGTELYLNETAFQWKLVEGEYLAKASNQQYKRSFIYKDGVGFKNYDKGNAGNEGYSAMPLVVEAAFGEGVAYTVVRENLEENRYYTVCLEKEIVEIKGASIWNLSKRGASLAYLEEASLPITAGTPFIIQATADKFEVIYDGDATPLPGNNGVLVGTFTKLTASNLNALTDAGKTIYMLVSNELRPIGTNNYLDAHRAYIDYDAFEVVNTAPNNAPGKRVRAIPMHKDVVTGFENINATDKPVKLLIDGNIYILRGEKMYDATGRLVK